MAKLSSHVTALFIVVALVCAFNPVFSVEEAEAKSLWNTCLFLEMIESCCHDLVQEGKVCHDNLIKYIADRPSLIGREIQILKKRDDVWSHCVSISKTA
ncbi:putative Prolamin-like domain-containing protein [Arabidopsis thaliana]